MPHARNAGFVGRERLLEQVRLALRPVADATRTVALTQVQAVHGLGGIGKTQVAIEFVHAHGAEFDAVFWVLANTPKRLASDFAELARVVGLPDATSTTDVNEQARAVRRWLESPESGRWLLVFDNVDEPEHLRGYLPTQPGGLVLTTSRRSHWPPGVRAFEVRELERPASVKLLLERSGQADAAAADRLAAALGDFPLALAQAAGYLAESGLALATYLDLYRERRAELLQKGDPPDGYTLTVFTTLDMAMSRINTPEAEELLGLIACLAPDAIPRSLLEAAFADPIRLADALAALGRHSLIAVGTEGVEAHRLVQAVAWDRMPPEAQSRHAARAVSLLEAAFPRECYEVRTWDVCKLLQPHAAHAARLAERGRSVPETIGKLLDRVGVFDEFRARSEDAEASFRQSLAVWEAAFGLEDPRVARTLTHLGRVLQDRGKLAEARRCLERALRIKEAAYGPDHPQVASTLGNLGNVAHAQGDLAEARRCQERALRIEETAYGPDHPEVASTLNNLGLVAQLQGDLAEARRCQERALRIKEEVYGHDHPEVALTLGNLGLVVRDQGDLTEARRCQEQALRIKEEVYGHKHPHVAMTLGNLGGVLAQDGEPERAKPLVERALGLFRQFLGDEHPHTVQARGQLQEIEERLRSASRVEESPGFDTAEDSGRGSGPEPG